MPSGTVLPARGFALSGHAFAEWGPEELIPFMTSELGIHALDYWPWNCGDLSRDAFLALMRRHGASVFAVNVPSAEGRLLADGEDEQAVAALGRAITEARELGAAFVQFYVGTPAEDAAESETPARRLAAALRPAIETAERSGITLLLENNLDQRDEDPCRRNPSRTAAAVREVIAAAASPRLRACFDPCNFMTVGEEAYPYAWECLRDVSVNVHLKDAKRYVPAFHADAPSSARLLHDSSGGNFLPVAVGRGAVYWDGIFRRLKSDSYDGWLTLDPFCSAEYVGEWCATSMTFIRSHLTTGRTSLREGEEQQSGTR